MADRSRPLVPLRAMWDKDSISKYPETLRVPMDDGTVVNYVIDSQQPHPCFTKAINYIKSLPLTQRGRHEKDPDL